MSILEEVADLMIEYFPNAVVLPTLGNNDCRYHYQTPTNGERRQFYEDYFNAYFADHPTNKNLPELEEIRKTVNRGGYFRVNVTPDLAVISLDTLFYNYKFVLED